MDSPDLPEPHPGDPWHPSWDAVPDDPGESARSAEAVKRIAEEVRRLSEDEELRTTMEAGAAGRRMIDQIKAVDDVGLSQLAWPVDPPSGALVDGVARSGAAAVPESTSSAARGWLGRLRRRGASTVSETTADEEDPVAVVDEQRDDDLVADEAPRDLDAAGAGSDELATDEAVADDVLTDEGVIEEAVPAEIEAEDAAAADNAAVVDAAADQVAAADDDEDDFPWDDEDWSTARTADDPPSTRELDLHADDEATPDAIPDRGISDRDVADLAAASVTKASTDPEPSAATALVPAEAESVTDPGDREVEETDPAAVDAIDMVAVDGDADDATAAGDDAPGVVADEEDTVELAQVEADEGVFTHAEVIPLVRPPQIDDEEVSAGLDPDLLAAGAEMRSEPDETLGDAVGDAVDEAFDDAPEGGEDEDADAAADAADFTFGDYTGTATEEYAELARAMAASETEEVELAAISAEMPGLDTTLVGLDDVVDAGIGVTETLSTTRRSDLGLRVATAIGLLILFFGSLLWPWAIGGLILVVFGVAALELYIVTVNAGFRPLTWAGLVGVLGALVGTWVWGVVAVPIALALTAIGATLFLALSAERRTPLLDLALTVAMMAWIGVLGAPAFAIVDAPDYRWLILAVVLTTAFMDVAQYFVGRALGRRLLSPVVSPKKTVEGLVGGVFAALIVGVAFGSIEASPFDPGSGLAFGAMVAIVAPLGDLAVSVVKRALGVKDMSAILPGHGGIMDRIDAMVFVIPSAWILFRYFDLLG